MLFFLWGDKFAADLFDILQGTVSCQLYLGTCFEGKAFLGTLPGICPRCLLRCLMFCSSSAVVGLRECLGNFYFPLAPPDCSWQTCSLVQRRYCARCMAGVLASGICSHEVWGLLLYIFIRKKKKDSKVAVVGSNRDIWMIFSISKSQNSPLPLIRLHIKFLLCAWNPVHALVTWVISYQPD